MIDLRVLPSIEELRQRSAVRALEQRYGHEAVVLALREETGVLREALRRRTATVVAPGDAAAWIEGAVADRLRRQLSGSLRRVINATGVIIHTNLGRAPLGAAAVARLAGVAAGYSNLEYALNEGRRGSRHTHAEALLCRLTGAETAVVVNNNAGAVLLILAALADGREVIISRGELIEIGGGFRIPDVMRQSGATLREVGTTNRTRAADYEAAIGERTAAILRVHPSNFRMEGFTERPPLGALVELARRFEILLIEDLGSGWLGTGDWGLGAGEPAVRASVETGVDVCCFSGDKLLGGPQAGIIVGRAAAIERVGRHPLMRALRVDKLTYAALEGTLLEYAAGRAHDSIPVARMIATPVGTLETRARAILSRVASPSVVMHVVDGLSTIGGGSAPGVTLPSKLLSVSVKGLTADAIESRLRQADPPLVARIEHDQVLLDLRTIQPDEDDLVAAVLNGLVG